MRLGPGAGLVMPTNVLWEWGWSDYKADVFQSRMRTAKWGLDAAQPQRSRFPLFPVFHIAAFQEAPSLMTTIKINSITCHHHPLGAEYLWDFLFIIFPGSLLLCGLVLSQAIWRHAANFPNHGDVFAFVWKSMKGKPHFFFFFPFSLYHSSATWMTLIPVAAEGNLAVMEVCVFFQPVSEDEKEAEAATAEPSLSVRYWQLTMPPPPNTHTHQLICFCIHLVQGLQDFCLLDFPLFFFFNPHLPLSLCGPKPCFSS